MTQETVLANATLVLPGETVTGAVRFRGAEILDVSTGPGVPAAAGGDAIIMPLSFGRLRCPLGPKAAA